MALAKTRRSCRAYRPDPVPEALIARVAEAGAWAASGMGMQSPIVVAVTQPTALETLRRINAEVMGAAGSDPFYGAPCVLVTLAARERPTAVEDGSLALGNMMLAAEALRLGACWIHRARETFERPEAQALLSALGAGYGSDFDMDDLKYHKVIILSDADQDGMHIRCILLTFFFRYMRELINNGNVYIGMPPLYKVYKKDVVEYAYDDAELQKKIEIVGKGYQIQRYKGLGEMSAEQLWETTMDPARRNLIRVNIEDAAEAEQMVTALMGDRVEARKEFLARNANFNKVDTFIDRVNL